MTWTRPTGVQGVSYIFDQNATTTPDETLDENSGTHTYTATPDGVWYFHLRAKYSGGWSSVVHIRLRIDSVAPESFVPKVTALGEATSPSYKLEFQTTDSGSGIANYQLALDTQEFTKVVSPYVVSQQKGGIHQFTLRAVDQAGNIREAIKLCLEVRAQKGMPLTVETCQVEVTA